MERYFAAQSSQNSASVYEHAIRAIHCVLNVEHPPPETDGHNSGAAVLWSVWVKRAVMPRCPAADRESQKRLRFDSGRSFPAALRHIKKGNGESLFSFSGELCVCTTVSQPKVSFTKRWLHPKDGSAPSKVKQNASQGSNRQLGSSALSRQAGSLEYFGTFFS